MDNHVNHFEGDSNFDLMVSHICLNSSLLTRSYITLKTRPSFEIDNTALEHLIPGKAAGAPVLTALPLIEEKIC